MMMTGLYNDTRIFVGQIPPLTTEEELKAKFPGCVAAKIVKDRVTGLSKR